MHFNTEKIKQIVKKDITIVAATKYLTKEESLALHKEGFNHFGENRVDSLQEKIEYLRDYPITWHIIGTLQTKKVRKIINDIDYLHSLDTLKLALEINKRREQVLPCFIQVNISDEANKHGLSIDDVIPFIKEILPLEKIKLIGLMGMAEHTDDEQVIRSQFQRLIDLKATIKQELNLDLSNLSMGMSNDYLIAQSMGATHMRLGSVLLRSE